MEVVPVIDLKNGVVVHARKGQRDRYRPIETPLAPGSEPLAVARGLMTLHPFAKLYVADLDAIAGAGDNRAALARIKAAFPGVTLWVDGGIATEEAADAWLQSGLGHLVLGSETQTDTALVERFAGDARVVLSLDYRGDDFLGPPALLKAPRHWPTRVIAMTLDRVGSGSGPDLERLRTIAAPGRAVYAAGGIRDAADLRRLADAGIAGALVASSLHDGRLTAADLRQFG